MEPEVEVECVDLLQSENLLTKDGEPGGTSPSLRTVASKKPAKRQTRQWAAWTHQEEESFFGALRQVGKNFEKITSRVQSKNKDQVRHYYYRLVRRMNKLLGPGFCLDARNSKDTSAAMLRWWSLLEKYSCKASKLHLKPRRFKIFIEALENQLLKDRKKNTRKRPSSGENTSPATPVNVPVNNKASGQDTCKLGAVESQNAQKGGSGKGSLKRNLNTGAARNNSKIDLSTVRTVKQRKKTGTLSSAAYKKWEKAAIAGVSLVADAAEHLERTITDKTHPDKKSLDEPVPSPVLNAQNGNTDTFGVSTPLPLWECPRIQVVETNGQQQPLTKLKLQLFPIDEDTRRALEKGEHNPYLELTLSVRKKISSVVEHLNRKWGNSSIATGELMLFQYSAERENLMGYPRWTQDTVASAADVYAVVGSPQIFRLRYGWFTHAELRSGTHGTPSTSLYNQEDDINGCNRKEQNMDGSLFSLLHEHINSDKRTKSSKDQQTSITQASDHIPCHQKLQDDMTGNIGMDHEKNIPDSEQAFSSSWSRQETGNSSIQRRSNADNLKACNKTTLSAVDWADSLTNISMGDLLAEGSEIHGTNGIEPPQSESSLFPQQIPFSCDSFDAAIAAHISRHQDKQNHFSAPVPHTSSIWDAEETCDAFAFQKVSSPYRAASSGSSKQITDTSSMFIRNSIQELVKVQTSEDDPIDKVELTDNCHIDTQKPDDYIDLAGFTDAYWPDSLGPLDLDIPSSRYHNQEPLFNDNSIGLSGLNRLIASSLDAFQNCSFFGLDKKEQPSSATEAAQGGAPLLDFKISGEV